ncbi:MAG TPA: hypothetical protein VKB27_00720 [Gammaproteobacteria bacterium]|nr:hypothetical protein [Gammaproteobacteria bacterium]
MNQTAADPQPQVEVVTPSASTGPPAMFFAIGIAINLALLTAFLLWAIRQWKKGGKRDP